MATLMPSVNGMLGSITLTKQSGTLLTLATDDTYVDDDIQFTIGVQSGAGAAGSASADADVEPTDDSSSGGINVYSAIGTKQSTEPTSGYYIRIGASASGNSQIATSGWLDAGSLPSASATATLFFPVDAAQASISGTNTVTPSASVAGTNVTLSNTDNGISVTATGGGTARANASGSVTGSGFAAAGDSLGNANIDAPSATTTAQTYISGVTIEAPASGTRSFSVTVPNGNSTVTFTYTVDSNGNVTVS